MAILHPTNDTFQDLLQQNKLVLVDFFATWCGPCKMIAPMIEALSEKYDGRAAVAKIDVDENPDLAAQFNVMSIPTVVLFKDGQPIVTEVGAHAEDFYTKLLDAHL